jgi:hypothetical protein
LLDGRWGGFPYDVFEIAGNGTPGRAFAFTAIRAERAGLFRARGTGSLTLHPERRIALDLSVERLDLTYLKPFGFVEGGDASSLGRIVVTGDPDDPELKGTLICRPGSFTPPTGFSVLRLGDGRIDFEGRRAAFRAELTDSTGAPVVVAGRGTFARLVPGEFEVSMAAPKAVRVDGLPNLFAGLARGSLTLSGTPDRPSLAGEVTLLEGRLQTPPRPKTPDPNAFASRVNWDLQVRFGDGVSYAVDPLGAAVDVARLSSKSHLHVAGRGDDFQIYGEITADSGPVTWFLGKKLFTRAAP